MKKIALAILLILCIMASLLLITSCQGDPGKGPDVEEKSYTVTFKQEGFDDVVKTVKHGESLTDIPVPQTIDGYNITWSRANFDNITENIIVNAIMELGGYKVTELKEGFTLDNNGSIPTFYKTVPNNLEYIDISNAFTVSDGCTWKLYTDFIGETELKLKSMSLSVGMNKAYLIVWHSDGEHFTKYEINVYRLGIKSYSFVNDGSVINSGNIEEQSSINAPASSLSKVGYTFDGWTVNGELVSFPYQVNVNTVFTAKYTANVYSIDYELIGGVNGENPETFTIEDLPFSLKDSNNTTEYMFNHWYKESDFSGTPVTEITEIGNITLYAQYVDNNLVFIDNGGNLTVSDYTGNAQKIVIPSIYKGKKVTSIDTSAFYGCTELTSIVIPNSVTSIGSRAFNYCTSLTSVVIPNSVTSIGEYAFSGCTILTTYCEAQSKPSGWNSLWNYSKCPVVWNCNNNDVANDGYIYTVIDGVRYGIKDGEATVVRQPSNIKEPIIKASVTYKNASYPVTSIGEKAFEDCASLTSVVIPNGVTSIGKYAFDNCIGLTGVVIPNSVTSIDGVALSNCTGLTIYCEAQSKPSGWNSFWNYSNSPVVWNCNNNDVANDGYIYTVIDGVRYGIKYGSATVVRQPNNIKEAIIKASITYKNASYPVTSIGQYAFEDCTDLTSVVIPNSVTIIGNYAFYDCTGLKIYCEAQSKPSGWDSDWNYSKCPVVWGYKQGN